MLIASKNTCAKITAHIVAARIAGMTIHNLPFSESYDHQEGINSGDLYSYQMEHLPIEAQIILAEHQLTKTKSAIMTWRSEEVKNKINMTVGINEKERYDIFKNAHEYLGAQLNSALKPLGYVNKLILEAWESLGYDFKLNIAKIEEKYPKKAGCYKKRMAALTPVLMRYLDDVNQFIDELNRFYETS